MRLLLRDICVGVAALIFTLLMSHANDAGPLVCAAEIQAIRRIHQYHIDMLVLPSCFESSGQDHIAVRCWLTALEADGAPMSGVCRPSSQQASLNGVGTTLRHVMCSIARRRPDVERMKARCFDVPTSRSLIQSTPAACHRHRSVAPARLAPSRTTTAAISATASPFPIPAPAALSLPLVETNGPLLAGVTATAVWMLW